MHCFYCSIHIKKLDKYRRCIILFFLYLQYSLNEIGEDVKFHQKKKKKKLQFLVKSHSAVNLTILYMSDTVNKSYQLQIFVVDIPVEKQRYGCCNISGSILPETCLHAGQCQG